MVMVSTHQLPQLDTEDQIQAWREERRRRYKECILKNNCPQTSKNEDKSHHSYSKNTRTELGNGKIFTNQDEKIDNDRSIIKIKTTDTATHNPLNDSKNDSDNSLVAIIKKDENDSAFTDLIKKENENKSLVNQKKDISNTIATTSANSIQMNNSCQNLINNALVSSNTDMNGIVCSNGFDNDSPNRKSDLFKSEKSFKKSKNKRNAGPKSKSIRDASSISRKKTLLEKLLEKDIQKEMSQDTTRTLNQIPNQNQNPSFCESINGDKQVYDSHSMSVTKYDKKEEMKDLRMELKPEIEKEMEKDHERMIVNCVADHYLTQK